MGRKRDVIQNGRKAAPGHNKLTIFRIRREVPPESKKTERGARRIFGDDAGANQLQKVPNLEFKPPGPDMP